RDLPDLIDMPALSGHWNLLPYSTDWHSCRPGNTYGYRSLRYSWTSMTAIDPSPTAEATRLAEPERTSPAANTPGWLVSSSNGGRRAVQWGDSARSGPVRTNPLAARSIPAGRQSVRGPA